MKPGRSTDTAAVARRAGSPEGSSLFGKKGNLIGIASRPICLFLVFRKVDFQPLGASSPRSITGIWRGRRRIPHHLPRAHRAGRCCWARPSASASGGLFSVMFIGYMANNVLPARLGEFVQGLRAVQEGGHPQDDDPRHHLHRAHLRRAFLAVHPGPAHAGPQGRLDSKHPAATTSSTGAWRPAGAFWARSASWPPWSSSRLSAASSADADPVAWRRSDWRRKLESVLGAFVGGVGCLRSSQAPAITSLGRRSWSWGDRGLHLLAGGPGLPPASSRSRPFSSRWSS